MRFSLTALRNLSEAWVPAFFLRNRKSFVRSSPSRCASSLGASGDAPPSAAATAPPPSADSPPSAAATAPPAFPSPPVPPPLPPLASAPPALAAAASSAVAIGSAAHSAASYVLASARSLVRGAPSVAAGKYASLLGSVPTTAPRAEAAGASTSPKRMGAPLA